MNKRSLVLFASIIVLLVWWIVSIKQREGFVCSAGAAKPWTASAAGWQPRVELIHNEHEPEQNSLAWSPETMPAPFRPSKQSRSPN